MVNEWYKAWFDSAYYHKLYFERNDEEAGKFLDNLGTHLQPAPESRMLDAACGRGRHARLLAEKGFDVTGVDLSFSSVQFANQFAIDRLQFYQHDLRLPCWINYFNYVFNFFTSFGYFATKREHDDAVRTMAQSLQPGGVLLLDYLNVHYVEDHLVPNEVKLVEGTTYQINRWHDAAHFYKKIVIEDAALDNHLEFTERVAKFSLADFTEMLARQQVQVVDVLGDYNLAAYDVKATPRLIVVGKKSSGRQLSV